MQGDLGVSACPQHGRAGARLTRTGRDMASVMSRGVFWGPGLGTPPRASNRAGSAAGASGVVLVVGDDETARAGGSVLCPRGVGTFVRACLRLQLPLPCVRGCVQPVVDLWMGRRLRLAYHVLLQATSTHSDQARWRQKSTAIEPERGCGVVSVGWSCSAGHAMI